MDAGGFRCQPSCRDGAMRKAGNKATQRPQPTLLKNFTTKIGVVLDRASRQTNLMTGTTFPDPNPFPSPEPAIPPVKEPPYDPQPRSPVVEPDDPAEPNQI